MLWQLERTTEGLRSRFYCSSCFHVSHCAVNSAASEKDKRQVEMFTSQRQSWSHVLWPDFGRLASRGRERVQQDVRVSSFRQRLKKIQHKPALALAASSQWDHIWGSSEGLSDTNKSLAERGWFHHIFWALTCALGDRRPRCASIILSTRKVFGDKYRKKVSVQVWRQKNDYMHNFAYGTNYNIKWKWFLMKTARMKYSKWHIYLKHL